MKNSFDIRNIVERGVIQPEAYLILEKSLRLIHEGADKRRQNYDLKNLDLTGHLTLDALMDENGELVTFSGIYNGGRYPEGIYRILNRVYVAPRYRTVPYGAYASRFLLPKQMAVYGREMKMIFVSREGRAAKLFLQKWCDEWAPSGDWKVSQNFWQVAPGWDRPCFQFVAFLNSQTTDWRPIQVTEEEWSADVDLKPLARALSYDFGFGAKS